MKAYSPRDVGPSAAATIKVLRKFKIITTYLVITYEKLALRNSKDMAIGPHREKREGFFFLKYR